MMLEFRILMSAIASIRWQRSRSDPPVLRLREALRLLDSPWAPQDERSCRWADGKSRGRTTKRRQTILLIGLGTNEIFQLFGAIQIACGMMVLMQQGGRRMKRLRDFVRVSCGIGVAWKSLSWSDWGEMEQRSWIPPELGWWACCAVDWRSSTWSAKCWIYWCSRWRYSIRGGGRSLIAAGGGGKFSEDSALTWKPREDRGCLPNACWGVFGHDVGPFLMHSNKITK